MVTVSAPGKVHLMGEHAVVYGRPALLSAVNWRIFVSVAAGKKSLTVKSEVPDDYVRYAVSVAADKLQVKPLPPLAVTVSSQLPAGYHLGSSAAVAVATAGAVAYFLKRLWNPVWINQVAYEIEKREHGNPSGGDNTAVVFGGFLWYRRELPFLKSMWQLPLKLPSNLKHFFLVDTGRPAEGTGEMVAYVKSKVNSASWRTKSKMEKLFNQNEEQTRKVALALKEGKEQDLVDAIQAGERTLEGMGVVSPAAAAFIRGVEKAGGAAKILGGGGRSGSVGFLLVYCRHRDAIAKDCRLLNYHIKDIVLGGEGVRLETGAAPE